MLPPVLMTELPPLSEHATETTMRFKIAPANDARLTVVIQGCEDCVDAVAQEIADVCKKHVLEREKKPCGGCP